MIVPKCLLNASSPPPFPTLQSSNHEPKCWHGLLTLESLVLLVPVAVLFAAEGAALLIYAAALEATEKVQEAIFIQGVSRLSLKGGEIVTALKYFNINSLLHKFCALRLNVQ